jgi:hypothetical protein
MVAFDFSGSRDIRSGGLAISLAASPLHVQLTAHYYLSITPNTSWESHKQNKPPIYPSKT